MKVQSALKKYFKRRTDAIVVLLEKPVQKFTVENFHQLRVEIKKLNSLFKLINFCSKTFEKKKHFKTYKSIFKQAGKIRELQLEEAALKKYAIYHGLKSYMNYFKKNCLKEKKIFFLMINKNLITKIKKTNNDVLPFFIKIKRNDAINYMDKKRRKIEVLFNKKQLKIEQVHKLRKLVKEFYCVWKSLNLPKQNKVLKEADAFQNILGKWHDRVIIKDHLKEAMEEMAVMGSVETKQLKKVTTKLSSDCKVLFRKINIAIHKKRALQNLISTTF